MKTAQLFILILNVLIVSTCTSTKESIDDAFLFEKSALFQIKTISYNTIIPGKIESNQSYNITIRLSQNPKKTILDSIYFRDLKAALKQTDLNTFTARLVVNPKKDIIMSSNSVDELENRLPYVTIMPFNLKDNECVISFKENSRTKFIKFSNVQKDVTLYYPSTNPKN